MGDKVEYIPEIILSFTVPRNDDTEAAMRGTVLSADGMVDSVEFHRKSEAVYHDDLFSFPATVRLKCNPFSLRTGVPMMVEMTAREICQELALVFPTEQYKVSWRIRFTSTDTSTIYSMASA
jgi:hypothetical protein